MGQARLWEGLVMDECWKGLGLSYGGARLWGGSGVGLSAMGLSCELSYGAQCYRAQLLSGLNYGTQRYGAQLWGSVMG